MTERPETVAGALLRRASDDNRALIFEGRDWSWREVVQACVDRAALWADLREPGPFHVGVLLDNVPEFVFSLGAAALSGATLVGLNTTRRGGGLQRDVRHTDCQLVVTDRTNAALLEGLDLGLGPDRTLLADGERFASLLDEVAGAGPPRQLPGPDTLFTLIFTSGSSGAPKAVRCTQGRLARTSDMGFTADDVLLSAMPLFHGNALFANWYPWVLGGATCVLHRRFSASAFLPAVRDHRVSFFNTVGQALSYILATPPTPHDRDHRLGFVLAPEATQRDMDAFSERFGCFVFGGYGSSEGAIRMVPPAGAPTGMLGTPVDEGDVAVVDPETGEERPRARFDEHGLLLNADEAIGEIVDRAGGGRFEGYYDNEEADRQRTRMGWFWSGDLAYRDQRGLFHFAGRSGDWLRVDGENFAAAPVERVLGRFPSAATVAVYAVPDRVAGDQVMAAIELEPGHDFDPDVFARFLTDQRDLGTKWAPRFVRIVASMPVTGNDKLNKRPLRADGWRTDDPVWWRPDREHRYRRLRPEDVEELEAALREHGRESLLPS